MEITYLSYIGTLSFWIPSKCLVHLCRDTDSTFDHNKCRILHLLYKEDKKIRERI